MATPNQRRPAQRSAEAERLGQAGPASAPAVSELTALLADPSAEVRMHAAWALGRVGAGSAPAVEPLAALIESLKSARGQEFLLVLQTLAELGPDANQAGPTLVGMVLSGAQDVSLAAAECLAATGGVPLDEVQALLAKLPQGRAATRPGDYNREETARDLARHLARASSSGDSATCSCGCSAETAALLDAAGDNVTPAVEWPAFFFSGCVLLRQPDRQTASMPLIASESTPLMLILPAIGLPNCRLAEVCL